MIGRAIYVLVLGLLLLTNYSYSRIIPVSVSEVDIDFNGQKSTAQQFQFICSHLNPSGTIQVGAHTIDIECQPPFVEYRLKEEARIPREIQLIYDKACLVQNIDSFIEAFEENEATQTPGMQRRLLSHSASGVSTSPQRGSRLGGALNAVGTLAAIGLSLYNTIAIDQINSRIDGIEKWRGEVDNNMGIMNQTLNSLTAFQIQQYQFNENTNRAMTNVTDQFNNVLAQNALLANLQNGTNENLKALNSGVAKRFNELTGEIVANQRQFQNQLDVNQNATNTAILRLADSVSSLSKQSQIQFQDLVSRMNAANVNEIKSQQMILDLIYDIQAKNLLTAGIFAHLDVLPEGYKPLFFDQGKKPKELTGSQLRTILDTLDINFRSTPDGNGHFQIYRYTLRFYMATEFAMENLATSFPNQRAVFSMMGPNSNCRRPYADPASDPDPFDPTAVECQMWMEATRQSCTTNIANFDWATVDPNRSPELKSGYCLTAPVSGFAGKARLVIRTLTELINFQRDWLCLLRGSSAMSHSRFAYMVQSQATGYGGFLGGSPADSSCGLAIDEAVVYAEQTKNTPLMLNLMHQIWVSRQLLGEDVLNFKMEKYGRIPGGIDVTIEPFTYTPASYNGSKPFYDPGATAARCLRADYLVATEDTLEVNSLQPLKGADQTYIQRRVTTTITNSVPCNPGDATCVTVQTSDITLNIPFSQDYPFPLQDASLMVGSFEPSRASVLGVYNIPSKYLSLDGDHEARKHTVSYYKFPAGTEKTPDPPEFMAGNNGQFKPSYASINPFSYKTPVAFDQDGYVMCDTTSGSLSSVNKTLPVKCALGMRWANASQTLARCLLLPSSTVVFNSWQDATQRALYGTSTLATQLGMGANSLFSFWFQSSLASSLASFSVVLQVTASNGFLRFIVDERGIPGVICSSSATSNANATIRFDTRTRIITGNIRDQMLHSVVWHVSNSGSGPTLTLWLDNIRISSFSSVFVLTGPFSIRNSESDFAPYTPSNGLSNADNIELGIVQPITTGGQLSAIRTTVDDLYSCHLSVLRQRCYLANEVLILDMIEAPKPTCLGTRVAFTSMTPAPGLPSNAFTVGENWSLGFWVRIPWNEASVDTGAWFVNLLHITRNQFNITVSWMNSNNAGRLRVSVNSMTVASPINVLNTNVGVESHHIFLNYFAANAQLTLYLDGVSQGASTLSTFRNGLPASIQILMDTAFMVTYYSNILTPVEINEQISCHLSTVEQTPQEYIPPIGFCVTTGANSAWGYCRHASLCDGHCITYASIDTTNKLFSQTGSTVCDAGFKAPDCLSRCQYVDSTGSCIDFIGSSNGLIPDGHPCTNAKFFQIYFNPQAELAVFTSREFLMTPTITVPTGRLTVVSGGTNICPTYSLLSQGDGSLGLTLQNSQPLEAQVRVIFYPWGYLEMPKPCTTTCCNYNRGGLVLSIPAYGTQFATVPQCNNMTVEIALETSLNQFTNCVVLTGQSYVNAVTSASQSLPIALTNNVQIRVNDATRGWGYQLQGMSTALFELMIQLAADRSASDSIRSALNNAVLMVRNMNPASWNFTNFPTNTTEAVPGLNQQIDEQQELLRRIKELQMEAQYRNEFIKNITSENALIIDKQAAILNDTVNLLVRLSIGLEIQRAIRIPGAWGGFDFVGELADVMEKTIGIVKSPVDGFLDGLGMPSFLTDIFGTFIKLIGVVVMLALCAGLGWVLFKAISFCRAMNKQESTTETVPRFQSSKRRQKMEDEESAPLNVLKTSEPTASYFTTWRTRNKHST